MIFIKAKKTQKIIIDEITLYRLHMFIKSFDFTIGVFFVVTTETTATLWSWKMKNQL